MPQGAGIHARSAFDGNTPLDYAVAGDISKIAQLLLAFGADVNLQDENYLMPLYQASIGGHLKIIQDLLNNAATKVNAMDNDGNTPLHFSTWMGHIKIVQILLTNGADV